MSTHTDAPRTLLPFQPASMTPAQLAAVSFLARYTGGTHHLYAYQLRRWFAWCQSNAIDPPAQACRSRGLRTSRRCVTPRTGSPTTTSPRFGPLGAAVCAASVRHMSSRSPASQPLGSHGGAGAWKKVDVA